MSRLEEALAAGEFVVTAEVGPPKGTDIAGMLEEAEHLKGVVHAVNVTDQQSSVMRLGSLAISHLLWERGLEPVYQVTCRDRNIIALQSDLLSSAVLGIENVLCLTGDYVTLGDHPQAKPVFDLDSVTLLETVAQLQEGHDLAGKPLQGTPRFFPGAVVNPGSRPLEPQIAKMEKKVAAGARFFQTQAIYDPARFTHFMEQIGHLDVPVLVGLVMLKSAGMARFMTRNVAGVEVPEALIEELQDSEDRVETSINITVRLIQEMKDLCAGVHIMALGWEEHVPTILERAGLVVTPGT
jgi:methylenetetrahydrofolate reductase (NADPH)